MHRIRLITYEICLWIKHLIHQLNAHLFELIATRFTSISCIVKTLSLLKSIFFSIKLNVFLYAYILNDDVFRSMINDMIKTKFFNHINLMSICIEICIKKWSWWFHDWIWVTELEKKIEWGNFGYEFYLD